jgi:methylated-DNA-protein-cysteine methyltransferase-like protein
LPVLLIYNHYQEQGCPFGERPHLFDMNPFHQQVLLIIRSIPRGKVAAYGQIAALAGNAGAARQVAWILHSSSEKEGLPWHRVINSRGRISLGRGCGFEEQKKRLEAEGVKVGRLGAVDLNKYLWEPGPELGSRFHDAHVHFKKLDRRFLKKWKAFSAD